MIKSKKKIEGKGQDFIEWNRKWSNVLATTLFDFSSCQPNLRELCIQILIWWWFLGQSWLLYWANKIVQRAVRYEMEVRRKWFSTWHTSHCLASSSKDQLEILFVKYVMRPGSSWPALHTQLVCCNNQPCKNVVPNLGFSLLCSALPFTKSIRVVEIQRILDFPWSGDRLLSVDYIPMSG